MKKRAIELKAGDRTPWYLIIADAEQGTMDDGPCVVVMVEWEDGGRGPRVFDMGAKVEVV